MAFTPPTRLGVYEVTAQIGVGGMGEVYRATDTKLKRQVAIKILPSSLAADPDRLARFQREAEVLASLNHPHIAAIYGLEDADGVKALVMELVEGDDLSQRIGLGAIPVDEALPIAKEIAEALEAAHEQGIIHRDLKPANVKVRPDGTVKVLDFGLAKAMEPAAASSPSVSRSPTITTPAMTQSGMILGTAAYMSPEQARGKAADKRSDVWAFGCVLYEMLTGKRVFEGEDVSDTLAAVLRGEPDWDALATAAPPHIRALIKRCLEKNRRERISDIAVVRFVLDEPIAAAVSAPAVISPSRQRSAMLWKAAIALALTTLGGLTGSYLARSATAEVTRFLVFPPEKNAFWTPARLGYASAVLSPDGRRLAFTAVDAGGRMLLWVRAINSLTAEPLPGTDDAAHPFWSPDSRFIAYSTPGKLMKIDVSGGPPLKLCDFISPNIVGRGGTWNRAGVIIFGNGPGPLYQVSSTGGQASPLMQLPRGQDSQAFPSFLPDGRHVLYYADAGLADVTGLHIVSIDTGESKRLLGTDSGGIYDPVNRFLLFVRDGTLLAQKFDPNKMRLTGEAVPIAERVESGVVPGLVTFSISESGTLAYKLANGASAGLQMVWLDRQGKEIETFGPRANYRGLDLAPDSKSVAAHRHDGRGGDIWVSDPSGRTTRLTFDGSQENMSPIWSPDGHQIVYSSLRSGKWGLYQRASNNTGDEKRLLESDTVVAAVSWSSDGTSIVYEVTNPKTQTDLWVLPLSGVQRPFPVVSLPLQQSHGQISPDGKWLAYESLETGRMEVYVQQFPNGAGKHLISADGGVWPRWRQDGHELFYMRQLPEGNRMMAVAVRSIEASLAVETPKELFDSGYINLFHGDGLRYHPYSVAADGQHFLIPRPASNDALDGTAVPMVVVLNWAEAVKK